MMATEIIPSQCKALVKREAGLGYSFEEIQVELPKDGELLVKVQLNGICGSDIMMYKWNGPVRTIAKIPFVPGHEMTGVVVQSGKETTIKPGQRICVENHFFCGDCYSCQNNRCDICLNMNQYGHGKGTFHGGCSQYSIVPEKYCYPLQTDIGAQEAVLMEPIGVAHNAIEQLVEVRGSVVMVTGCGPIGLSAISIAKISGAKRVIAVDVRNEKLEKAKLMGADRVINAENENLEEVVMAMTNKVGIDRICECSGSPIVNKIFSLLRKGGQVVLVGLPKTPIHIENPLPGEHFVKEATNQLSRFDTENRTRPQGMTIIDPSRKFGWGKNTIPLA